MTEASEVSQVTEMSQAKSTPSEPVAAESSGFAADKRQKQDSASSRSHGGKTLKTQTSSVDDKSGYSSKEKPPLRRRENKSKRVKQRERVHPQRHNSFEWSDIDTPENSYGVSITSLF